MFSKYSTPWTRLAVKAIVPAILLVLLATQALAASSCKKVSGKFTFQTFSGPDCTSPNGVCARGNWNGDLAGTSTFTGTSLVQTVDTPTTGVVLLTGDTLLTTRDGTVLTKAAIALSTTGNGEFAGVDTLVSGSGAWAGNTGRFSATGTLVNGVGTGTYSGEFCGP